MLATQIDRRKIRLISLLIRQPTCSTGCATSRYYYEGERIEAEAPGDDEVASFITGMRKAKRPSSACSTGRRSAR